MISNRLGTSFLAVHGINTRVNRLSVALTMGISRAGTAIVDNLHSTPGVCVFDHVLKHREVTGVTLDTWRGRSIFLLPKTHSRIPNF